MDLRAALDPDMRLAASDLIKFSSESRRGLQYCAPKHVEILIVIEDDLGVFGHGRWSREPIRIDRYDQRDAPFDRCSDAQRRVRTQRMSNEYQALTRRHGGRSFALDIGCVVEILHRAGNLGNAREFVTKLIQPLREYHARKSSDCEHPEQRVSPSRPASQGQDRHNEELASK